MGNEKTEPTVRASMLTPVLERSKGEFFKGKPDVNQNTKEMINDGFVISVGDCEKDGVMPNKDLMSEMAEKKRRRDFLSGRKDRNIEEMEQ